MTSQSTINKVVNYYDGTAFEYNVFVGLWKHHGIHYGYYDKTHKTPSEGITNFTRMLAKKVRIRKGEKVLDAGCGIGGSSIWIAKNIGAHVTGITLSQKQRDHAEKLAQKYGLTNLTNFLVRDYCDTKLPAESFDVVWGLESICYAERKIDFLKEAHRILKPGGRIVVADGFQKKINMTPDEKKLFDQWLYGWVVPNLATVNGFAYDMKKVGFKRVFGEDVTGHVKDFALWLHNISKYAVPILSPLKSIGIFSQTQVDNGVSAIVQYPALKQGLWAYMVYTAKK